MQRYITTHAYTYISKFKMIAKNIHVYIFVYMYVHSDDNNNKYDIIALLRYRIVIIQ